MKPPKNLIRVARDVVALEELLLEQGGEIDCQNERIVDRWLEEVKNDLMQKVDSYEWVMKKMEAEVDLLKSRAEEFTRSAKILDNFRERLKMRIKQAMQEMNVTSLKGEYSEFKLAKTKARLEFDESMLLPKYFAARTVTEVDKAMIRESLEQGIEVSGARLVESFALRMNINKGG